MTLIIGGGVAGSSLAIRLARTGRAVTLIERTRGAHDKVCGEFLSIEAQDYLRDLAIEPQSLGAVPIDRVRLEAPGRSIETALPFTGLSLTRSRLDTVLLERASAAGVTVHRGLAVRALERGGPHWTVRLETGERIATDTAILATGKRDLGGWPRGRGVQRDLVAFKTILDAGALPGCTTLLTFADGYAGVQPVEGGRTNLCLVVRKRRLGRHGGNWAALALGLAEELPGWRALFEAASCQRPLALAAIPYGFVRWRSDGLWRIGDQAAVVPSFTGDGMAMALHSAALAARMIAAGAGAAEFQARLAHDLAGSVRLATALSLLLVRPRAAATLIRVADALPWLVRAVARRTRVPEARRQSTNSSVFISAWTEAV